MRKGIYIFIWIHHHTVYDCILSCLQVVIETTGVQMLVIGQYRVVAT